MSDPPASDYPSPHQPQPAEFPADHTACTRSVHRTVSVGGSGGVTATVIVVAQRGKVWVSITPPFTSAAIMESGKVDEVINTLALAREDAKKMAT